MKSFGRTWCKNISKINFYRMSYRKFRLFLVHLELSSYSRQEGHQNGQNQTLYSMIFPWMHFYSWRWHLLMKSHLVLNSHLDMFKSQWPQKDIKSKLRSDLCLHKGYKVTVLFCQLCFLQKTNAQEIFQFFDLSYYLQLSISSLVIVYLHCHILVQNCANFTLVFHRHQQQQDVRFR